MKIATGKVDEEMHIAANNQQHKPALTGQLVIESDSPTKSKNELKSSPKEVKKRSDQTNGEN
ncbi:MAG: hypothetical protein ACL7BU_11565 [Candidatus Phlomobacter fragariae]